MKEQGWGLKYKNERSSLCSPLKNDRAKMEHWWRAGNRGLRGETELEEELISITATINKENGGGRMETLSELN